MPTKDKKLHRFGGDITYPLQRLTWAKKKARDFEWAEKVADFYDYYYGNYYNSERIKRLKMNYNLYNGRGEEAMGQYYEQYGMTDLEDEGIEGGYADVQHHPLMDQIAKAMVGEQQRRPLKPIAIDSSGYTMNMRKMRRNQMFQQYIEEQVLNPIRQQAMQRIMLKLGVTDPYSLNPDEQQEMNLMVENEVKASSPDEIENYMRKDYKSPSEMQAQKLLDYLMGELDIKYVTDEGFKHAIITGEEIYHVGVRHNNPFIKLINPIGFTTSAARNTHFIEDGEWAKYEQYIKYTDLFNEFGDVMTLKDYKKMENVFNAFGGNSEHSFESNLVAEVSAIDAYTSGMLFQNAPDIRTQEGQDFMKGIYKHYGSDYDGYSSVRHVHLVWKSLRKLKYIQREDRQRNVKGFWVDESYTFDKMKGDVDQQIVWVPEVWSTDKIGTTDALYLNKGPLPYQYRSLDDPWDTKLPYVGVEYGRLFGNAKNVSPMDLGKPWQYKFNIQMAKIHEMEATDVGKVLLTTMGAKPKEWSWGKWIMMMKYGKMAVMDTHGEGFNPSDAQIFKQIDLSTLSDLAGRLQYLEFIRNQVALSMSYNPSRLGQVAPYVAVTNTQQSIVQSSYQTEDIYSTHNKVVENVLNTVVRAARLAFKNNDFARTYLLDDMSIAELELDWQLLDQSKIGVKIRNSSDDFNNIMNVKSVAQAMVQNGLITMPELIKLMWANNGAEILNVAEHAEQNAEKRREQQFQEQQQLMQQQAAIQKEVQELQQAFEREKDIREAQKDLLVAEITATRFAQQADIDQNKINDDIQREELKIAHDAIQKSKDRELDLKKHKDEMALKEKDIRAKNSKKP